MNFRNIFIVIMVLFIALGISAVSAENITNEDNAIDNEYVPMFADVDDGIEGNATEIVADNVTYKVGDDKEYSVTLLSNGTPVANQNITFFINDEFKSISETNENGTAFLDVEFLDIGNYDITCKYAGNDQFNASQAQAVVKVYNTIIASDLTKYYKNSTQFVAHFYDENGTKINNKNATFTINGQNYTKPINNGTAKININLGPGIYVITVNNTVTNEIAKYNITVLPTIKADNLVKYFRNGSQFQVTILDGQGNPLSGAKFTININGVIYSRTSNDLGIGTLSINLGPNKYVATVNYNGGAKSYNVTVLSTINASNYKTTYQTGGRFTFQALDGQGNPAADKKASLNINGMVYQRTTDANGTAGLNINLRPGSYVCTVSCDGLSRSYTVTVEKRTPSISVVSSTVVKGQKLECKISYNNNPIANNLVIFIFNETKAYGAYSNNEGIAGVTLELPAGSYLFYIGIQNDPLYSNIMIGTTVTVVEK